MENLNSKEKGRAAFGVFLQKAEINAAKADLEVKGFTNADISVLYPPRKGPQDFPQRQRSSVRFGWLIGGVLGGLIFFVLAVLTIAGVKNPTDVFYETYSFFDQILIILSAVGVGALIGAAAGTLVGIGTPENAGLRYGDYVDAGGILMSVHVDDEEEAKRAKETLEKNGAQDITLLSEGPGWETVYSKILALPKYRHT